MFIIITMMMARRTTIMATVTGIISMMRMGIGLRLSRVILMSWGIGISSGLSPRSHWRPLSNWLLKQYPISASSSYSLRFSSRKHLAVRLR